ncbi:TetR/AcrR family transcriptional regulator [Paenibacillus tritici]|uniref:TetR/AcrR family transcriptional regulator n=1 Tax=Paenibacillus tritici TaxID=1873425 RepID=A0ABX2DVH6_9BACL|nr:TetR/AcrR family transcriptional regulator [Paenibacillus tritici]NQX47988.1 TetR/AcrR family transcriptional regulator [Paenibacillus tritici]
MNQRERLTKLLLKQSLISLLQEKNISQISVKELCAKADINRSTFYLHFANAYGLLEYVEQEIITSTREYLDKIEPSDSGATYILAFLDYIKKNDDLFTVMLIKSNDNVLFPKRLLNEILMNIDSQLQLNVPENMKRFTYTYLVNGSLAIIQEWIRDSYSLSSHDLAQLIFSLADHSLAAFKSAE